MPLRIFENAVRKFDAGVADTRAFMAFASAASHVRPYVSNMVDIGSLDRLQKDGLTRFVSQKDFRIETGFNGLYVLLAGGFEQFVRSLVYEGVIWLNKSCKTFDDLREQLRIENLHRSGTALRSITEPLAEIPFDFEALCRNLGTCHRDGGSLTLNADAIASRISNVTPLRLDEAMTRIGVKLNWDVFGRAATIQSVLGTQRVREANNLLQAWLKEFISNRNKIAHSGAGGLHISETELAKACDVLSAIAPVLATEVEAKLK